MFNFQFGRWSLLTAGILYGAYHHNRLSKKEAIFRKLEAEKQVVRDAQEAIAKKKRAEGNNIDIVYCSFVFFFLITIYNNIDKILLQTK